MTAKRSRLPAWAIILLLMLLVTGAVGAAIWQGSAQPAAPAQAGYQTITIRPGDITLTASGSGSIIVENSADLSFLSSGTVTGLSIQLGDQVKAGQKLASLDSIAELEQAVANAQLNLQIATKALRDLETSAGAAVAQALADRANAQAALADAQKNLRDPHASRCDDDTIAKYYQQYLDAVVAARPWQTLLGQAQRNGQDLQYYQEHLAPLLEKMYRADINYQYCLAYTPEEIRASQAVLELAQAQAERASQVYQTLAANNGIDPLERSIAQAAVDDAEMKLAQARSNLEGATLTAPISGTIIALNGENGEPAPQGVFITIADLTQPRLQVSLDETDLQSFAKGCKAEVTFTSLPGQVLSGSVTSVYPELASTQGVSAVQGIVTLEQIPSGVRLPPGLTASVDITCIEATDVITIPIQALIQAKQSDVPYVAVLNASGQPEKREVVLGLQTSTLIEIKSGLTAGDRVVTNPYTLP